MLKFEKIRYRDDIALERFKELATPLLEEYFKPIIPQENLEKMIYFLQEKAIAKEIKEKRYEYYFICYEGKYIGFIEMKERENMLNISRFYLKKEKRKQGFGRKIIEYLKEFAKKQNLKTLRICIPNLKEDTNEIFQKLGFRKTEEIARYIGDLCFIYEHIYLYDLD